MKKRKIESIILAGSLCLLIAAAVPGKQEEKEITFHTLSRTPVAGVSLTEDTLRRNAAFTASLVTYASDTDIMAAAEPKTGSDEPVETVQKTDKAEEPMEEQVSAPVLSDNGFVLLEPEKDEDIQKMIYNVSEEYGLDYRLVTAVVKKESNFTPDTISKTDDWGLMQINSCVHSYLREKLKITDMLDPEQNVRSGCFLLKGLLDKYKDPAMALTAYNRGEGGAKKLFDKGIYTSDYAEKVLSFYEEYKKR